MRLLIAAVGRLKDGPERELFERYARRIDESGRGVALGPLKLVEIPEARAANASSRKTDEAQRLLAASDGACVRVALDENGRLLSSEQFAKWISEQRDNGRKSLAFLIGGADGHGADVLDGAQLKLALGPMTLPHGLARIVLVEQIYRAATILAGHPYHRS